MKIVRFYDDESYDNLEITHLDGKSICIEICEDQTPKGCIMINKQTALDFIEELKLQVAKLD